MRYKDVVNQMERTVRTILEFLGEPWDDSVLGPDKAPHDVAERSHRFTSSRGGRPPSLPRVPHPAYSASP